MKVVLLGLTTCVVASPLAPYLQRNAEAVNGEVITETTVDRLGLVVNRIKLRYGPFVIPANNVLEPQTASTIGIHRQWGGLTNVPSANIRKPCAECMITQMQAGLENDSGMSLNVDTGVMLHHMLLMNGGKGRRDATCGVQLVSLPQSAVMASGRSTERFFSSGNERSVVDFMATGRRSGYRVRANDKFSLLTDLMNMNPTPQKVWVSMIYEYVPFENAVGFTQVKPIWLDFDNCMTSDVSWPTNLDKFKLTSQTWTSDFDGNLLLGIGHLHDGGTHLDVRMDNTVVCSANMTYGASDKFVEMSAFRRLKMNETMTPYKRDDVVPDANARATLQAPPGAMEFDAAGGYPGVVEVNSPAGEYTDSTGQYSGVGQYPQAVQYPGLGQYPEAQYPQAPYPGAQYPQAPYPGAGQYPTFGSYPAAAPYPPVAQDPVGDQYPGQYHMPEDPESPTSTDTTTTIVELPSPPDPTQSAEDLTQTFPEAIPDGPDGQFLNPKKNNPFSALMNAINPNAKLSAEEKALQKAEKQLKKEQENAERAARREARASSAVAAIAAATATPNPNDTSGLKKIGGIAALAAISSKLGKSAKSFTNDATNTVKKGISSIAPKRGTIEPDLTHQRITIDRAEPGMAHISHATQCSNFGFFQKGDKFEVVGYYDLKQHATMRDDTGRPKNLMAIAILWAEVPLGYNYPTWPLQADVELPVVGVGVGFDFETFKEPKNIAKNLPQLSIAGKKVPVRLPLPGIKFDLPGLKLGNDRRA